VHDDGTDKLSFAAAVSKFLDQPLIVTITVSKKVIIIAGIT